MELKVKETQLPQPITFNYDELKEMVSEKAERYANIVYTDETIKEAKEDKAKLNKLKKTLNDERIRREKEYMKPFNEFKGQINEIIKIIDKPVNVIDSQIKDYQESKKTEKHNEILREINEGGYEFPEGLDLELIWNPKWLNASCSMSNVRKELKEKEKEIALDLAEIDNLVYRFEARERYMQTLNFREAVEAAKRAEESERRKAEYEAEQQRRAEATKLTLETTNMVDIPISREEKGKPSETKLKAEWVPFKAYLTISQAKELKAWCDARGIQLKAIREA